MNSIDQSELEEYDPHDGIYTGDDVCCPHCGADQEMFDYMGDLDPELFKDDGESLQTCRSCDKEFLVSTYVRYNYTSFREVEGK